MSSQSAITYGVSTAEDSSMWILFIHPFEYPQGFGIPIARSCESAPRTNSQCSEWLSGNIPCLQRGQVSLLRAVTLFKLQLGDLFEKRLLSPSTFPSNFIPEGGAFVLLYAVKQLKVDKQPREGATNSTKRCWRSWLLELPLKWTLFSERFRELLPFNLSSYLVGGF